MVDAARRALPLTVGRARAGRRSCSRARASRRCRSRGRCSPSVPMATWRPGNTSTSTSWCRGTACPTPATPHRVGLPGRTRLVASPSARSTVRAHQPPAPDVGRRRFPGRDPVGARPATRLSRGRYRRHDRARRIRHRGRASASHAHARGRRDHHLRERRQGRVEQALDGERPGARDRREPGLDWREVQRLARRGRVQRMVAVGLALARSIAGDRLPPIPEGAMRAGADLSDVVRRFERRLLDPAVRLANRPRPRGSMPASACSSTAGSIAGRAPVRRVVTPTEEDWAWLDLPAWLEPAYYAVRPARVMRRRLGRLR